LRDGEGIALAVYFVAQCKFDPAFGDAIFLNIGFFLALKANANALQQDRFVVESATRIYAKSVRKDEGIGAGLRCIGHLTCLAHYGLRSQVSGAVTLRCSVGYGVFVTSDSEVLQKSSDLSALDVLYQIDIYKLNIDYETIGIKSYNRSNYVQKLL
jgi:hypothetical protein